MNNLCQNVISLCISFDSANLICSVIGLISFGVIVNDLTLTMAAVEELIKLEGKFRL